jgi:2-haloacid dehalogenase
MKLSDYKALTFDVYGTLIDWETGIVEGLSPLVKKVERELSRDEILEAHARHESTHQRYTPAKRYQKLLPVVYRRLAEEWGVSVSWDECLAYGQSVKNWPAFPDSANALQYLKKHFKLVVLTNVDNDSFKYSNEKLNVEFDGVYSAEDIGSYKPFDRNFDYLIEMISSIGITKEQILHTAESMFHDHVPANKHGLTSCHIYRRFDKQGFGATMTPEVMPKCEFKFNSMADLVKAHQKELEN